MRYTHTHVGGETTKNYAEKRIYTTCAQHLIYPRERNNDSHAHTMCLYRYIYRELDIYMQKSPSGVAHVLSSHRLHVHAHTQLHASYRLDYTYTAVYIHERRYTLRGARYAATAWIRAQIPFASTHARVREYDFSIFL